MAAGNKLRSEIEKQAKAVHDMRKNFQAAAMDLQYAQKMAPLSVGAAGLEDRQAAIEAQNQQQANAQPAPLPEMPRATPVGENAASSGASSFINDIATMAGDAISGGPQTVQAGAAGFDPSRAASSGVAGPPVDASHVKAGQALPSGAPGTQTTRTPMRIGGLPGLIAAGVGALMPQEMRDRFSHVSVTEDKEFTGNVAAEWANAELGVGEAPMDVINRMPQALQQRISQEKDALVSGYKRNKRDIDQASMAQTIEKEISGTGNPNNGAFKTLVELRGRLARGEDVTWREVSDAAARNVTTIEEGQRVALARQRSDLAGSELQNRLLTIELAEFEEKLAGNAFFLLDGGNPEMKPAERRVAYDAAFDKDGKLKPAAPVDIYQANRHQLRDNGTFFLVNEGGFFSGETRYETHGGMDVVRDLMIVRGIGVDTSDVKNYAAARRVSLERLDKMGFEIKEDRDGRETLRVGEGTHVANRPTLQHLLTMSDKVARANLAAGTTVLPSGVNPEVLKAVRAEESASAEAARKANKEARGPLQVIQEDVVPGITPTGAIERIGGAARTVEEKVEGLREALGIPPGGFGTARGREGKVGLVDSQERRQRP